MTIKTATPSMPSETQMRGLVIEGITGAGKTELISSLKSELKQFGGFDVKELSHVDCDDQYARYLKEYATQERVLFHRSHVSEHVLGKFLRRRSPFFNEELLTLNNVMVLRFVCVLVEPTDFESFLEHIAKDTRHIRLSFNRDQYDQIIASFRDSFNQIPHVRYVSSSFTHLESVKDGIIAKLRLGSSPLEAGPEQL